MLKVLLCKDLNQQAVVSLQTPEAFSDVAIQLLLLILFFEALVLLQNLRYDYKDVMYEYVPITVRGSKVYESCVSVEGGEGIHRFHLALKGQ